MNLLSIIFPELLLLLLLQLPELDARPLNHPPVDHDRETALVQAPSTLELLGLHIIPLHKIIGMRVTGYLRGDKRLGRNEFIEGTIDAGLLLRVVWARESTGEVAGESAF